MKRKAHGSQKPRHLNRIVEVASTAQRNDSPARAINQRFLKCRQPPETGFAFELLHPVYRFPAVTTLFYFARNVPIHPAE